MSDRDARKESALEPKPGAIDRPRRRHHHGSAMHCRHCHAALSPKDIKKRRCPKCNNEFVVGQWRPNFLVGGAGMGCLAVYTYVESGTAAWLGIGLLSLISLFLFLRARR